LLVSADGLKSKIRAAIRSDDKLDFTGVVSISGDAKFEVGVPRPVDRNWGPVLGVDEHSGLWSLIYMIAEPRASIQQPIQRDQVGKSSKRH